jgi:hypothetical protein
MRPVAVALVSGAAPVVGTDLRGQMGSPARARSATPAPGDDRAALRALFDAASTGPAQARMQFSSAGLDDMRADRFRGAAVAPRATIR